MPTLQEDRRTLAMLEFPRAAYEATNLLTFSPVLATTPRGDGHGVFVLPGFAASDRSTDILRSFLRSKGYETAGWGLGRNLGLARSGGMDALADEFSRFADRTRGQVSLVGWSLGGVYARRLARLARDRVRQVITLGSPIAGDPQGSAIWRVYQEVNGQPIGRDVAQRFMTENAEALHVPSTALFSRTDPVVPWQMAREVESAVTDNIEVPGSHVGLGVNPLVYYLVARKLTETRAGWRKFDQADPVYQVACRLAGIRPEAPAA